MMDAIQLTKELIQIESTDPGSYELQIKTYIKTVLKQLPQVLLTEEEVLPGRFNLMAELPLHAAETPSSCAGDCAASSDASGNATDGNVLPSLVFICHMDTVVVGSGWTRDPFGAQEEDGRIYGRGACDMKAGLACCLSAFAWAAAQHSAGFLSSAQSPAIGSLKLICTVDEEDFMRGAEACIRSGWVSAHDWILDAEPTNGQIQVAHKGRSWYEIHAAGHTAHASTPWKGADAIAATAELIHDIRCAVQAYPPHAELGCSTVTFGQIQGGYRPYVVPDACDLWIDLRLAPPLTTEKTTAIIEAAIARAEKEIAGVHISYTITGDRPFIEKDPASPLLKQLRISCDKVCAAETPVGIFPGYTDTAVIAGQLNNHNCMSYGPGNLECAHQPDEWVATKDIVRCEAVYRALIQNCLG